MSELVAVRERLAYLQTKLHKIFEEAGGTSGKLELARVSSLSGTVEEKAEEIRRLDAQMNDLGVKADMLVAAERVKNIGRKLNEPAGSFPFLGAGGGGPRVGELFTKSRAFTERVKGDYHGVVGPSIEVEADVKSFLRNDIETKRSCPQPLAGRLRRSGRGW